MIKAFKIVNHLQEELYLDIKKPEDTGFAVTSVTGLSYPKIDISSQTYTSQDGDVFGSMHVDKRNIVMNVTFWENNKERLSVEDLRWKLQRHFLPKEPLIFYAVNDHGTFWIKGYIESVEPNIFSSNEGAQISILCEDPNWNLEAGEQIVSIGTHEPLFEFPFSSEMSQPSVYTIEPNRMGGSDLILHSYISLEENKGEKYDGIKVVADYKNKGIEFGKVKDYPSTVINYPGSAVTGMSIYIEANGPVEYIRIDNKTRSENVFIDGEKLARIVGTSIQRYDEIVINTHKKHKTANLIRDGIVYNIMNACLPVLNWPQLQTGENVLTYSTFSDVDLVKIHVNYQIKFLGI